MNKLIHERQATRGPLTLHPQHPRYFADATGRPIYLTGSHTWSNMQEYQSDDPKLKFDFDQHLEWLVAHGFNFTRGWVREQGVDEEHNFNPNNSSSLPYLRTGPGLALDGLPRYDLTKYNEAFFQRLRSRIMAAGKRGIYISVMFFQSFSIDSHGGPGDPWRTHPYHKANNVNGVDGDPDNTGGGRQIHTLRMPNVTRLQEAYVRKVIDSVNDLDNIIYEIGNEHYEESCAWQYHLVNYIKSIVQEKTNVHLVGMTSGGGGPDALTNEQLLNSPADWISPRNEELMPFMEEPPVMEGIGKAILSDTDHLWGLGGSVAWVWKTFLRGHHPILMDPYQPLLELEYHSDWSKLNDPNHPLWEPMRQNMAYTLAYAGRINLVQTRPRPEIASSGYCLADLGKSYLVYVTAANDCVTVAFAEEKIEYLIEWLCPMTGEQLDGGRRSLSGREIFHVPFAGGAVLFVQNSSILS